MMELDDYERGAYREIVSWFEKQAEPSTNPAGALNAAMNKGLGKVLALPGIREATKAVEPLITGGFATAATTVDLGAVAREYQRHGAVELADIRKLSMKHPDTATADFGTWYTSGAVAEGAAFGGAALIPGVGNLLALGLMGADVVAITGLAMRMLADYSAHYGYDPNDEAEQIFMQGIFGLVGADATAKLGIMQELRQITILVGQNATWAQLQKHITVNVIQGAAKQAGQRLIKRQLGVIVPVLGAGVNAAANGWFMSTLDDHARYAYRQRFLAEKRGVAG